MLHPSYTDLMKVVNKDVEQGETKVVNSLNQALDPGTNPEAVEAIIRRIDDYCLGYKLPGAARSVLYVLDLF